MLNRAQEDPAGWTRGQFSRATNGGRLGGTFMPLALIRIEERTAVFARLDLPRAWHYSMISRQISRLRIFTEFLKIFSVQNALCAPVCTPMGSSLTVLAIKCRFFSVLTATAQAFDKVMLLAELRRDLKDLSW